MAAHAVGTTTGADPDRFAGYSLGDLVGQMGVEKAFQAALFGVLGRALLQLDSARTTLGRTTVTAAKPGKDVVLTLDVGAQRAAERVLRYVNDERERQGLPKETTLRGALVATNPQIGELALASTPTFDPDMFVHRPVPPAVVRALLADHETPLTNRAVSAYPPTSTFKVVSSLALLDGGTLTPRRAWTVRRAFRFRAR